MDRFHRIKSYFKENKKTYIIGIFWLLAVDIAQLMLPKILGNMTDSFQMGLMDRARLLKYVGLIFLTGIFQGVGRYFWRINISGNAAKLDYTLRKDFFSHLLSLSPDFFYSNKTGDLMSHATNDITTIRRSMGFSVIMFMDALFIMLISLFMMVRSTNLSLTLIAAINLPIIIILTRKFGNIVYTRSRASQKSFSQLTEATQENYSGIRVIKAFAQEDLVYEHFKDVNRNNYNKNMDLVKVSGFFSPMLRFIYSLSILVTIYYGGRQVIRGRISLGDFVAFNSYLGTLQWPTRAIGQIVNNIQRGAASIDRLEDIFTTQPAIREGEEPVVLGDIKGAIRFKEVSFKYPGAERLAIEDIDFQVEPGRTLAIIGRTGSGKSTISNLLLRLYDINQGEISLDGVNIKDLGLGELRENIAYVSQDNFLFSSSIKDNIGFAFEEEVDDELIYRAASQADVYDNIRAFPEGFETVLGERGITLSGGQKQRTAMARAFIKDAPILIMDDSLSAVDTETEEVILKNIDDFARDKTKIIISHRVSTIQKADEILVMDEGLIVERGSHKELLEANNIYRELYEKQLLEEEEGLDE